VLLAGDADAAVFHADPHTIRREQVCPQSDRGIAGAELERIVQQELQQPPHCPLVGQHGRQIGVDLQIDALEREARRPVALEIPHRQRGGFFDRHHAKPDVVRLGELAHALDDALQARDCLGRHMREHGLVALVVFGDVFRQQVHRRFDLEQGRAQLVRDRVDDLRLEPVGALGLGGELAVLVQQAVELAANAQQRVHPGE